MLETPLNYDDDNFPTRARKLIANGTTFSFEIAGPARRLLEAHLSEGTIVEPSKLGLKPKLQALLAILMLAEAQGRAVSIDSTPDVVRVWVGVAKA